MKVSELKFQKIVLRFENQKKRNNYIKIENFPEINTLKYYYMIQLFFSYDVNLII